MDALNGIKAVLFDFDDTLGNREVYAYECYKAYLKTVCDIDDPVEFEAVVQDCMLWDERGNVTKKHVVDMLGKKYGINVEYEDFLHYWENNLWKYCVAFDDSYETLLQLSKKYLLGIITNGPSEGQRKKVEHAGLAQFFGPENIIVSGDYPFSKPDIRIFQEACRRLGVKPEEAVFVGDIYANDVLGAYRAGMHPVWIWTPGVRCSGKDVPVIHKVSDLLRLF